MNEQVKDPLASWPEGRLSAEQACEVYDSENPAHVKRIEAILERAGDMLYTGPESSGLSEIMQPFGYSSDYLRGVIAVSAIESFILEDGPSLVRLFIESVPRPITIGQIEGYFRKRVQDAMKGEEDVFLNREREKMEMTAFLDAASSDDVA